MVLKRSFNIAVVLVLAFSVTACGMSHRGRNTAIGAGVGAESARGMSLGGPEEERRGGGGGGGGGGRRVFARSRQKCQSGDAGSTLEAAMCTGAQG